MVRSGGQLFGGLLSPSIPSDNNISGGKHSKMRLRGGKRGISSDGSHRLMLEGLDSPFTSLTEATDTDITLDVYDDKSLASHPPSSSSPPTHQKSVKALDDSSLARASSYLQKHISAKGSLLISDEDSAPASATTSGTSSLTEGTPKARNSTGRLEDRFLSSLNRCDDDQTLHELRCERAEVAPIVIEEEDSDEEDEERWKAILQSNKTVHQVKTFLAPPTIHRLALGTEAERATPFVVQHTGNLHPDVPQIFIV